MRHDAHLAAGVAVMGQLLKSLHIFVLMKRKTVKDHAISGGNGPQCRQAPGRSLLISAFCGPTAGCCPASCSGVNHACMLVLLTMFQQCVH